MTTKLRKILENTLMTAGLIGFGAGICGSVYYQNRYNNEVPYEVKKVRRLRSDFSWLREPTMFDRQEIKDNYERTKHEYNSTMSNPQLVEGLEHSDSLTKNASYSNVAGLFAFLMFAFGSLSKVIRKSDEGEE